MSKASTEELVKNLGHPNGWWRDTAQRLLVEKSPSAAIPLLKQAATTGTNALSRLHAIWTLEGMAQLDVATITTLLKSEQHSKIRAAAIRLAEPMVKGGAAAELFPRVLSQLSVPHLDVQLQLAFTLGEIKDPKAEEAMATIARNHSANDLIRSAIISGLALREVEFVERLLGDSKWKEQNSARELLLSALSRCVINHGRGERVAKMLDVVAKSNSTWQQRALLDGMVGAASQPTSRREKKQSSTALPPKRVRMTTEPAALALLKKVTDKQIKDRIAQLDELMVWPGKPGVAPEPPVKPLTAAQEARFEMGKQLYTISCASCHQAHGFGQDGLAPPLVDSEWVAGSEQRLVRIVLHGLSGPLTVKGQRYDLDMPSLGTFDDEQLASILTYIRREWEHTYDPIEPETVKAIRQATTNRDDSWRQDELLKIK
jgi:mono/diheme cytochrome c family protein